MKIYYRPFMEGSKMSEELISKKEILDMTGISYGQLYRWKRKDLIPEEWFIKKSSYTGQETFFPKEKIIERINKIIELKDTMPLDELAEMFSNRTTVVDSGEEYLLQCGLITSEALMIYKDMFEGKNEYSFKDMFIMYVMQSQLDSGVLSISEIEVMVRFIDKEYSRLETNNGTVYFIRRLGVGICLAAFQESITVEGSSKVVGEVNVRTISEAIKFKLTL